MSLKELTFKQVLDGEFYMAARAMETMLADQALEHPDLRPEELHSVERCRFWLTPDNDLIASFITGFGPREPDLVWDGALWEDWHEASWICSEDDLSEEQKRLMDRVAKHCPGGLGGWS